MGGYIFDINDIPLIATALHCVLLGGILFFTTGRGRPGNGILATLLLAFGIRAVDDLIYWNPNINPLVVEYIGIWFFWAIEWVTLCMGPLLYAYIRLRLVGQPIIWRQDAIHTVPIILGILTLTAACLQMDTEHWHAGVKVWHFWYINPFYQVFLIGEKLSILLYAIQALRFMKQHKSKLVGEFSDLERAEPTWLNVIVIGFFLLGLWFSSFLVADYAGFDHLTNTMGVLANYFVFLFITVLVAISLMTSHWATPLELAREDTTPIKDNDTESSAEHTLRQHLIDGQLFLNPELTLSQLAAAANMPSRKVSEILNFQIGKNFFDFVNSARVEKAKELLASTDLPIISILQQSGFNSKPSFNRIFKRYVNQTPRDYRNSSRLDNADP